MRHLVQQWRQAALSKQAVWYDDGPPAVGFHATTLVAARAIEREGFREDPYGTYFANTSQDALKFIALRLATGQIPGGQIGVVLFQTKGLDIMEGTDHSPAFFGADTTSWVTHDRVGPERILGIEEYEYDASTTASRTAAKRMPAKFPGKCSDCGTAIAKGEMMVYDGKVHCTDCKSGRSKRKQPMFDCPFHGRVPDEGWHEDCIRDWRAERGYR